MLDDGKVFNFAFAVITFSFYSAHLSLWIWNGKYFNAYSLSDPFRIRVFKASVGAGFIINLPDLGGEKKLNELGVKCNSLMEF